MTRLLHVADLVPPTATADHTSHPRFACCLPESGRQATVVVAGRG